MSLALNIIVSCSDRKRLTVPRLLQARALGHRPLKQRFEGWWTRLSEATGQAIPANDLYLGDHWQICRSLPAVAKENGFAPRLWIASAGYGLVSADALLHPYSATFATGQQDTVVSADEGTDGLRDWWALLAGRSGPLRGSPRSITEVVKTSPKGHVVVVSSPNYIKALRDDLLEALGLMARKERFLVVTSRTILPAALAAHVIPSEARLKGIVGGALPSLHARIARKILSETHPSDFEASKLRRHYDRLLRRTPELPRFERAAMTDQEVRRFISARLHLRPGLSRTPLLRELRDRGFACEQARFGALYREVAQHVS